MSNTFLLSWDVNGIEAIIDISKYERETTWAVLQNKPGPGLGSILNAIILRARYNSQRHYEIYTINVEEGISEDDIRTMFESDPQGSADLVRDRGRKIYSDRLISTTVKIL